MERCSTLKKKNDRSEIGLDDTNCYSIISYLRFCGPIFSSVPVLSVCVADVYELCQV